MTSLDITRQRLAKYYLGRLRIADTAYRRGQTSNTESLSLLSQDWAQIAQWQAWAASHRQHDHEIARLCAAYPQAGAEVLITRQTPQERIHWLEAGLQAARALGDRHAEGICLFRMAWAIHKQALLEPAARAAREALACAEQLGDTLLIGQCLHLLGEITIRAGDFEASEPLHRRSLDVLQSIGAQAALADVYFSLSEIVYFRGDYEQARDLSMQCYQIHLALGINPATTNNLTCLGIFTAEAGDLQHGIDYVQQSIELCRRSNAQSTLAHAIKIHASLLFLRQELPAAARLIEESLELAQSIGEAWLIPDILIFKGRILAALGEREAALLAAHSAISISREMGYQLTLLEALISQADVLLTGNQSESAAIALYEGLRRAVEARTIAHSLYAVFVAARLFWQRGDAAYAAELVGMLQNEPRADYAVRSGMPALSALLESSLGQRDLELALERGRVSGLECGVPRLLEKLSEIV